MYRHSILLLVALDGMIVVEDVPETVRCLALLLGFLGHLAFGSLPPARPFEALVCLPDYNLGHQALLFVIHLLLQIECFAVDVVRALSLVRVRRYVSGHLKMLVASLRRESLR